mmetsp:Transcript_19742/g.50122  ORF Transcript_19742/g.50122 Transcript_19742/m.50122 type:complete len:236 (+) Transcript_19742:90-797(+)
MHRMSSRVSGDVRGFVRGARSGLCCLPLLRQQRALLLLLLDLAQLLLGARPQHELRVARDAHFVVHKHALGEQEEAGKLQQAPRVVEVLLPRDEEDTPNDDGAHRVEHHAGGGGRELGHGDAKEVEERDGQDHQRHPKRNLPVVAHLDKGIDGVFKLVGVFQHPERGDQVEEDQQDAEDGEAKHTLQANGKEGRNVVLSKELLLHHHLNGHDQLRRNHEAVAQHRVGAVARFLRS